MILYEFFGSVLFLNGLKFVVPSILLFKYKKLMVIGTSKEGNGKAGH